MNAAGNTAPSPFNGPGPSGLNRIEQLLIGLAALLAMAVVGLELTHAAQPVIFGFAAVTLTLLAWLLGESTEQLGHRVGGRLAGLMNATLGNLPELIVVLLLIRAATSSNGLLEVAKASIIGSVLGNMLLVLGLAFLVGGLKHGAQTFSRSFANLNASLLVLAVAGIALPTLIHSRPQIEAAEHIQTISLSAAVVLFIAYIASVVFTLGDTAHQATDEGDARWSKHLSISVLAASAVGVAIVSEALVGSMEETIVKVGISETFMGFILVPIIGNIAEHLVAVQLAARNDMDFAITIALGSSVQVALGLAPVAVFLSYLLGNPLNLVFDPLELLALTLAAFIIPIVVNDGESTWIEGLQLLAIYMLIAIGFWY